MKKLLILLLAVSTIAMAGTKEKKPKKDKKSKKKTELVVEKPAIVFANDIDSMSYALGVNIANDLTRNLKTIPGGTYNKDLFMKAFSTVFNGDSAVMSNENAMAFLQGYFTKAQEKQAIDKKSEGEKFLKENAKNPAVQTTASGLQYIVLTNGNGPKPAETDKVKVHYEGTLLDGTKFDSSYDRGEPIEFQLNQVIKGWTEGVQLMPKGSKYKFFIPYELAYGEQGAGGAIPPFATLIFVVELIDINAPAVTDQIKPLEIK